MKASSKHVNWVVIAVVILIVALVCASGYFLFGSIRADIKYAEPTPTPVMQPTLKPQPTLPAPATQTPDVNASPQVSLTPTPAA